MATATELRELDDDELDTRLVEYRRELLNLHFQLATGQLDNYSRVNETRRNVARVLMVLRDREIALAEGRDAGPVFLDHPVRPPRHRAEVADTVETADEDVDELDDTLGQSVGAEIDADEAEVDALPAEDEDEEEDQ
jgi:large subunit ribosomal protein L29